MPEKDSQTPEEHRLEADLRVCDPSRTDRTEPIEKVRIDRMAQELYEGFALLKKYTLAATFFGSARCCIGDSMYDNAMELAEKLARSNFAIITGGAGGVMRAANQGAHKAGGQSIGLNIKLPHEQNANEFLTEEKTFNYFFTRKVMLAFASEVYVYFPGGFGTLDELFEMLTLVQTKKIKRIPIVLVGKTYWDPIVALLRDHLYQKYGTIDKEDLDLFVLVDTVDEAYETILDLVEC